MLQEAQNYICSILRKAQDYICNKADSEWGKLNADMLEEIVKHIDSYRDYVMIRAVCKSLNSTLVKVPKHIKVPWLVLPFEEDTFIGTQNLSMPHFRMPELKNTEIRGSSFGWLICIGIDGRIQAINPFTKSNFDLPPLSTFPSVIKYQPDVQDEEYVLRYPRLGMASSSRDMQRLFEKIIFSCSPNNVKEFMAVAIHGEFERLAFYRFGDDRWTDIDPTTIELRGNYEDMICHEGKVYAIDFSAYFYEFDMKTSHGGKRNVPLPIGFILPYHSSHKKYLAVHPDGNLLLVVRHFQHYSKGKVCVEEEENDNYKTSRFDMYKLDASANRWSKEFSLGDHVLVIGLNSAVLMPSFLDHKGNCMRNTIYYNDNMWELQHHLHYGGHDVGVFNLENRISNQIFPNAFVCRPPPIWILSD
ncbi:hypothetical protein RJT34_19219 [Clitoria ternatea]|uniref:KIB1-4 beta-propeller domain-containing protein n=1 Tax=Clitoria ternatea TaxID=43366 RepID=A0AAN9IR08_CLITE